MSKILVAGLTLVLAVAVALPVLAQSEDDRPAPPADEEERPQPKPPGEGASPGAPKPERSRTRPAVRLELGTTYHDNFLQASYGRPELDIFSGFVRSDLSWQLGEKRKLRLSLHPEVVDYEKFPVSPSLAVRLRGGSRRHVVIGGIAQAWDRPGVDTDEGFLPSDTTTWLGTYELRLKRLQAAVDAEWSDIRSEDPSKDAVFGSVEAGLRWRFKSRLVTPSLAVLLGRRDPVDKTRVYLQRDVMLRLAFEPWRRGHVTAGYRLRHRSYTTGDEGASSYRRDDERDQWSLSARFDLPHGQALNLYWSMEEATSSSNSGNFLTHLVSAWWSKSL